MPDLEGFSSRIFLLRKSANRNQEEVGIAIGLTKSSISSFEKGKSIPSPENLVKMAVLFNVSVDYLLTGHDSVVGRGMDLLAHADTLENRADIVERRTTVPDGYKPKEAPSQTNHSLDGHSLSRSNKGQLSIAAAHYKKVTADVLAIPKGALPAFDQIQVDRRFLTELDYLLKIRALPSYTAWAQAVDVSANYVAAIERGRYHCNLELLYRTARCFPDFDFNYVLFGSASSNRPEPTDLPKRDRGRRKESDFWERLKDIITSNNLAENELWPGDCIDLANDKKVYELYVDEYGPIKDHNKYMHDIEGIINVIINEIKAESNK